MADVNDPTNDLSDAELLALLMEEFGLSHEMALREVAAARGRPYDDVIEADA